MTELIQVGCGAKKMELMRSLTLKTALVRMKHKPAETFFVKRCYRAQVLAGAEEICASQREVLEKLGLPWRVLRSAEDRNLILFYDVDAMSRVIDDDEKWEYLSGCGYDNRTVEGTLDSLCRRFEECDFPQEIGLLLGYPLKDVVGFTCGQSTPTYRGSWMVYGDVEESLKIMDLFRRGAREAERIITQSESWEACVQQICALKLALV